MKIMDNKDLGISKDLMGAWPFWNYGWYGSDGTDWRSYATACGLKSVPDYAEEATPLTIEQAKKWLLLVKTENTAWSEDGTYATENIRTFFHLTVDQLLSELPNLYNDRHVHVILDGNDRTYELGDVPRAVLAMPVFKATSVVYRDAVTVTLQLIPENWIPKPAGGES